jgi:hypothetical protein
MDNLDRNLQQNFILSLSEFYYFFIRILSRFDTVYMVMCRHNPYTLTGDIKMYTKLLSPSTPHSEKPRSEDFVPWNS